MNMRSNSHNPC